MKTTFSVFSNFLFFWIFTTSFSAYSTDFDYIAIGSSPIMLIEALYLHHKGNHVLIVERESTCGGAWKSISACGIDHIDMGCHIFGNNKEMKHFFEGYLGCNMIDTSYFEKKSGEIGYYPSSGCFELVHSLVNRLEEEGVTILTNHEVDGIYIDEENSFAEVSISGITATTKKILYSYASELFIRSEPTFHNTVSKEFPHIYLLVEDPTDDLFFYVTGSSVKKMLILRISNLSPCCSLKDTKYKIFAIEVRGEIPDNAEEICFTFLKEKSLLHPNAILLKSERYTFRQSYLNRNFLKPYDEKVQEIFCYVNTLAIWNVSQRVNEWKKAIPLYSER